MRISKFRNMFLAGLLASLMLTIVVVGSSAYGYNSGGAGNTSTGSGCTEVCKSTGARWQWYEWPDEADSVYFDGAKSGVVSGVTITGCADAGGFWRYAPVNYKDYTKQVGAINLSGNSNSLFDSTYFGGRWPYDTHGSGILTWSYNGKNYTTQYGASMSDIQAIYEAARETERQNNNGANPILNAEWGGKVAWFCGPAPASAQSAVYYYTADSGSGWGNTNITSSISNGYAETNVAKIKSGDTITIGFLHNPYTNQESENVNWNITFGATSDGGYSVVDKNITARSGTADLNTPAGSLYTVANRPYSDGNYYLQETYALKFNDDAIGKKYTFCEIYSVYGSAMTRVCTFVEVEGTEIITEPGECADWKNETVNYTKSGKMEGWTEVINKVKNSSLTSRDGNATYSNWQREITYAKPTDIISWTNCYYPGVQEVADTEVTYIHAQHSGGSNYNTNYAYSNNVFGTWENKFMVTPTTNSRNWTTQNGEFVGIDNSKYSNFGAGNTTIQSESNNYTIKQKNDVSSSFKEKIESGIPTWAKVVQVSGSTHKWGCCGESCRACHHHLNLYGTGERSNDVVSDEAQVIVPYNFTNTAGLDVRNSSVVYAGETVDVKSAWVNIETKRNEVTKDTYTTQVDNAQVKLMGYVTTNPDVDERRVSGSSADDICTTYSLLGSYQKQCAVYAESGETTLNPNGKLNGNTMENQFGGKSNDRFDGTYNVFDASAGDYFCMVMAVWPSASGDDKNTDPNGDKKWYISKPVCKVIAKRPSLQVLGGDIFSNGGINTSVAAKSNIYGAYNYNVSGGYGNAGVVTNNFEDESTSNGTIFGSWVEQGVIANGKVTGFASGAGTGLGDNGTYAGNKEGTSWADSNFCKNRTSLSFANYGNNGILRDYICPKYPYVGGAGITSGAIANRESLASYWVPNGTSVNTGNIITLNDDLTAIASPTGRIIRYAVSNGDAAISGATIAKDHTYIVKIGGGATISGNIIYDNASTLSSSGEIPKVVIYVGGDIIIGCNVTQLDALIIAEGKVNTCNDGDVNSSSRSNRLTVRGVIISDSLEANRTYGASMGAVSTDTSGINAGVPNSGSAAPAEIINYDTSAILWGRYMAGSGESDTLTTIYQHELAPRY